MEQLPKRKTIRLENFDYSTPGAYFITICSANRKKVFWQNIGTDMIHPSKIPLSDIGKIVDMSIQQIPEHYENVSVDKYCIMPDHVHLLLQIREEVGRIISAPTVPTIVGSMKRWVSRQIGSSIWQKSFYDHGIRNQQDYNETWEYIENNPKKYLCKIPK